MIYMRGQAEDYDGWAQIFAEDETRLGAKRANEKRKESAKDGENGEVWSWRGVLPGFTKSEDFAAGASIQEVERGSEGGDLYKSSPPKQEAMHGVGGEWRVEKQRLSWKVLDTFRDACEEQGIPKVEDFNRGNNFGSSYFHVNQRGGWRWNTSKAWLHPIMGRRANLTVLTHVHVLKVLLDKSNGSALGVEFARSEVGTGVVERAYAGLETILAAGAVGSPHLLQLSGVGPPAPLRSADVPVKHALSGVGANLQDHLQLRMVFRISGLPTLNEQYASWWGRVKMGLEYLWDRRGPLSMAPSQVGVFCKSEATLRRPDLEFHVQPLSLDRFGEPLHPFPAFTASVCHLQPTSRGSVLLRNRDPRAPPRIQPNYLATAKDRAVAARALRLTRRLVLGSRAFLPFKPEEYAPGITCQSQAELEDAAGKVGTTIFHPAGTCKMGRADDPLAVLDARLRVRGIERLRVCDTSAMPVITSGNTSSPTLMIAEKASDFLHAAHGTAADKP
ncbi:hypothetical protein NSK_001622 [Nannochloropsis salina CCMP1776]|uniref:Glucose-methanol-choline oxidoreductase N-terminal domain-containing protein n=1 Tax=Nannochloropsis salina CCMP1776 TaxID=1027361 RepID=A0A4D9D792_9STRA|nr:hypothetical protein NSK_001622 [Nannochloropsis salina CCMP1776]|eukprot:TFJ87290.1 hypothetical protein NSK_001622 [Nannochloropsis salina CCMP1776]